MDRTSFFALAMVCAIGSAAIAAESDGGFPSYTKQDEMNSCLFGYGTENSSIVDCIARDEKMKIALSKTWPSIDDRFKKDCMDRLAIRHLKSYYYLDHCIQSSKRDAAAPPD